MISLTNSSGSIDKLDIFEARCNHGIQILSKSNVSITNSHFITNRLDIGSVYIANESVVFLDHCTFKNNDDGGYGGPALFATNSSVEIRNSIFEGNGNTWVLGGAIHIQHEAKLIIISSAFNFNEADSGGAIYMENLAFLEIHNSTFDSNMAGSFGGAICSMDFTIKLNAVSFNNNSVVITYSRTQSNKFKQRVRGEGPRGGAIYVNSIIDLTCVNCQYINNTAGYQGGALWGTSFGQVSIANSHFAQNRAEFTHGGAVYLQNTEKNPEMGKLLLQNSSVVDNHAGTEGGSPILIRWPC